MLSAVIDVPASSAELLIRTDTTQMISVNGNSPHDIDILAMRLWILLCVPTIGGDCHCRTREDDVGRTLHEQAHDQAERWTYY